TNASGTCQIFNGLDGAYYWLSMQAEGKLYRYSGGVWGPSIGTGKYDRTNCADGTAASECKLNAPNYFVSAPAASGATGDLFGTADGVVRTLDRNGSVLTLMGQPTYYGDAPYGASGTPALSARLGQVNHMDNWTSAGTLKVVLGDYGTVHLREADV